MLTEHQQIALTADVPEEGLQYGDVGTIISVHKNGEAYTVEFMTLGGKTIAIVTLLASQVRAISKDEMQQARPLQPAA